MHDSMICIVSSIILSDSPHNSIFIQKKLKQCSQRVDSLKKLTPFYYFVIRHAIVEELAGFGATVHTCSRNEVDLNQCLSEWRKKGLQVTGSVCDVSSRAERENLISTASNLFNGKLNILVSHPLVMLIFWLIPPLRLYFSTYFYVCICITILK